MKTLLSLLILFLASSVSYAQQLEDGDQSRKAGLAAGKDRSSLVLTRTYSDPPNPTIWVALNLDQEQAVEVAFFDLLGRQLQQVRDGRMEAGMHHIQIDVSGVSSGHYFLRVVGETVVTTKHIILTK